MHRFPLPGPFFMQEFNSPSNSHLSGNPVGGGGLVVFRLYLFRGSSSCERGGGGTFRISTLGYRHFRMPALLGGGALGCRHFGVSALLGAGTSGCRHFGPEPHLGHRYFGPEPPSVFATAGFGHRQIGPPPLGATATYNVVTQGMGFLAFKCLLFPHLHYGDHCCGFSTF